MTDGDQERSRKTYNAYKHKCSLCNEEKAKSEFTMHMWHKRLRDKPVLCLDCCRPRCTSKKCQTCAVCRHPTCMKRKCDRPIVSVHPKQFLTKKHDLATYLCERCRWITCACGNTMPKRTQRLQKSVGTFKKQMYICSDCNCTAMFNSPKTLLSRRTPFPSQVKAISS